MNSWARRPFFPVEKLSSYLLKTGSEASQKHPIPISCCLRFIIALELLILLKVAILKVYAYAKDVRRIGGAGVERCYV